MRSILTDKDVSCNKFFKLKKENRNKILSFKNRVKKKLDLGRLI